VEAAWLQHGSPPTYQLPEQQKTKSTCFKEEPEQEREKEEEWKWMVTRTANQ
jgi:hypothetical protein